MIGESSPASYYNTSVAMEFFRFAGRPKTFAKGKKIFSENQRGIPFLLMPNRMYLLLDGEVGIFSRDKPVATVRPGQIFGEMASIDQGPRTGTAVTKSARHYRVARSRDPAEGIGAAAKGPDRRSRTRAQFRRAPRLRNRGNHPEGRPDRGADVRGPEGQSGDPRRRQPGGERGPGRRVRRDGPGRSHAAARERRR